MPDRKRLLALFDMRRKNLLIGRSALFPNTAEWPELPFRGTLRPSKPQGGFTMARWGSWQGNRYRGSRGTGKWGVLALAVLALALAAAAVWFFLHPAGPERAESPPPAASAPAAPAPAPTPEPEPALPSPPEPVRGIYISGPVAGDPYMETLLKLVEETELNAVVIDVKNDEGQVTYRPASGTALEIGACVHYIQDLPGLVAELKERGVYTIARIAAFKDPVLAGVRPELALTQADGTPVSEGNGPAWVNPCLSDVWDYLEEIALGAADAGFDEVQFDYVRFPTGKAADQIDDAGQENRSDVIAQFLESVVLALHDRGVRVSADVFGTVITNRGDGALLGQDYPRMAELVDCLCPMVYPSHYAPGAFGLEVPDQQPYETVSAALQRSGQVLSQAGVPQVEVRAWLQDFTATWVRGHLDYGAEEVRAQIQAVYDAGYDSWLLWNAKNSYTAEGLLPAGAQS